MESTWFIHKFICMFITSYKGAQLTATLPTKFTNIYLALTIGYV